MPKVYVQNWIESERGWGTRPDGFTVHPDRRHRDAYVAWYYKEFNNQSAAPDCYTRVEGDPIERDVTDEFYAALLAAVAPRSDQDLTAVWGESWCDRTTPLDLSIFR